MTSPALIEALNNIKNGNNPLNNPLLQSLLDRITPISLNPKSPDTSQDSKPEIFQKKKDSPETIVSSLKRKADQYEPGQIESENFCKIQRMKRNRESAARSRQRKREQIEELQSRVESISVQANEAEFLKEQVRLLQEENLALKFQLELCQKQNQQIQHQQPPQLLQYHQEKELEISSPKNIIQDSPLSYPIQHNPPSETSMETHKIFEIKENNNNNTNNLVESQVNSAPYINKYATLDGIFSLQMEGAWIFWRILFGLVLFLRIWIWMDHSGSAQRLIRNSISSKNRLSQPILKHLIQMILARAPIFSDEFKPRPDKYKIAFKLFPP